MSDNATEDVTLLTVEEAAVRLGISRSTMYSLIRAGSIRSVKLGKRTRLTPQQVSDYITEQT